MPQLLPAADVIHHEKQKLYGLDHLRAFAIIFVFLFHYKFFLHPDWEPKISSFGWTGVDLFFVLSGFLISGQLFETARENKKIPLREFFIKRFFRIIPPYAIVLMIYFLFPSLGEWGHLSHWWKYVTFTLNFDLNLAKNSMFTHAWSLCVEEQFYLLLPLCFWLFTRYKAGKKSVYLILFLLIAGFVCRELSWDYGVVPHLQEDDLRPLWNRYVYYPTYNRLDGLLIGVSIAGLFTFYPKVKEWVNSCSTLLLFVGLIALVGAYFVCIPKESYYAGLYGFALVSIGYGLILAAVVSPANIFYKIRSQFTEVIATLSYSIYLIHKIAIHLTQYWLGKAGMDKSGTIMLLCCIITTVGAAALMRVLIEKPALRLRNKVLNRIKAKKAVKQPTTIPDL